MHAAACCRFRPGSHRVIARHNSSIGGPRPYGSSPGWLPQANGTLPARPGLPKPACGRLNASLYELLSPDAAGSVPHHQTPISIDSLEPLQPAVGDAGYVSVTTTALVHRASTNADDHPRMSIHLVMGRQKVPLHSTTCSLTCLFTCLL